MKKNILIAVLLLGLFTACGTQPTDVPASDPGLSSVEVSPVPAAPTDASLPTEAVFPTTAPVQPTVPPTSDSSAQAATVSFSADVLPILQSRCFNCHGGDDIEEGLNLTTFAGIIAGSDNGPVIIPGDAANSLLAEQVVSQEMPKRGPKLTPPQVQIIVDWINQGALDN
ncbi:MAG TPA: c-type cytochrome domain-containing protein [Anaerolineales bacterium]|nr:c-type cytochrome domain-containing protein [Anaerolineales bacterium]